MHIKLSQKIELIEIVETLMRKANIPIRDTWKGWSGDNYDDFYTNNNSYGGTKQFDIILKDSGRADVGANKVYVIPDFTSIAYDNYKIKIPLRLSGKRHPIVHEIIHFLQENTIEQEKGYIEYNGKNYHEYVSQKSELEAHYIQLLFIEKYEINIIDIDDSTKSEFIKRIIESLNNSTKRLELILYSKSKGII